MCDSSRRSFLTGSVGVTAGPAVLYAESIPAASSPSEPEVTFDFEFDAHGEENHRWAVSSPVHRDRGSHGCSGSRTTTRTGLHVRVR